MKDFINYQRPLLSEEEMLEKSRDFFEWLDKRRTVREFSDRSIPQEIIENLIKAASTAPSGAHKQPWTFCVVANQGLKKEIRIAAEQEEYENYHGRMSEEWLDDLKTFATDWHKPFLETAPILIVVFRKIYELDDKGNKKNNYSVNESVGLACGFLLAAIHQAGLIALTHTPSPMNFLSKILERPVNEKPFLLIPVGYPLENMQVPDLRRKNLDEISVFFH